jgi:type III secretion protein Q
VLVLERLFFHADGTGHVAAGRQRLLGRIGDETGPLCLTVTSL